MGYESQIPDFGFLPAENFPLPSFDGLQPVFNNEILKIVLTGQ